MYPKLTLTNNFAVDFGFKGIRRNSKKNRDRWNILRWLISHAFSSLFSLSFIWVFTAHNFYTRKSLTSFLDTNRFNFMRTQQNLNNFVIYKTFHLKRLFSLLCTFHVNFTWYLHIMKRCPIHFYGTNTSKNCNKSLTTQHLQSCNNFWYMWVLEAHNIDLNLVRFL